MIGLFLSLWLLLFGLGILFNAAFSDRAQTGFFVAVVGFLFSCGFAIAWLIALVAGWGGAG